MFLPRRVVGQRTACGLDHGGFKLGKRKARVLQRVGVSVNWQSLATKVMLHHGGKLGQYPKNREAARLGLGSG
jgi:hypothetical protein